MNNSKIISPEKKLDINKTYLKHHSGGGGGGGWGNSNDEQNWCYKNHWVAATWQSVNWKRMHCILNNLNNKPLTYLDNDIELLILTPNSWIYGHCIIVSENEFNHDDTSETHETSETHKTM